MNEDKNPIERIIQETAEETRPNAIFAAELEEKLRRMHVPRRTTQLPFRNFLPIVTGAIALGALTFFTIWLFANLSPKGMPGSGEELPAATTPAPEAEPNPAPEIQREGGYDFRGGKLFLSQPLPELPQAANVYTLSADPPATLEQAQALAAQFGLQGDIYTTAFPGAPSGYIVTDGKRILTVYTVNYFNYAPDVKQLYRGGAVPDGDMEAVIAEFLSGNGFDFPYVISETSSPGMYEVYETAPDGLPIRFGSPSMRVTIGADGEVAGLDASLKNYDPNPVGGYGVISAQEALDALLDETGNGPSFIEMGYSTGYEPPLQWFREYPDNQTVTISGSLASYDSATPGGSSLYLLDGVPLAGNTSGLEALDDFAFIQATGQFVVEGDIRRFVVESFNAEVAPAFISGALRSEGGAIILTNDMDGMEYVLPDAPADLPLNTDPGASYLGVNGVIVDGVMDWTSIQFYADASNMGGGGGGGGAGFRKLNLSGEPIPFPTPIPTDEQYTPAELASFLKYPVQAGDTLESVAEKFGVSVEDLMRANFMTEPSVISPGWTLIIPGVPGPTRLENTRGVVQINLFLEPGGSQRAEYWFTAEADQSFYALEGDNLEALQELVNRPIAVTGDIRIGERGETFLVMESFEPLYPGLQFQIMKGRQEQAQINGEPVIFFASEGTTYVQLMPTGGAPDQNYYQTDEGEILLEALAVPDETYAGYPAIRVFSFAPAIDPVSGKPFELPITADKLEPIPDPTGGGPYEQPDLVIESVELAYYVPDTTMQYSSPSEAIAPEMYLQPIWLFHGRYANGFEVNFAVQALQREFLSPEYDQVFTGG